MRQLSSRRAPQLCAQHARVAWLQSSRRVQRCTAQGQIGFLPPEDLQCNEASLPDGLVAPDSMFGLTPSQMLAMGLAGEDVSRLQHGLTTVLPLLPYASLPPMSYRALEFTDSPLLLHLITFQLHMITADQLITMPSCP
jgi:hypothetical protein